MESVMPLRLLLLAMILGSCAPSPPPGMPRQATELVGRVAGAPRDCVPIRTSQNLRIADGDPETLVYGSGQTVWANHIGPGCSFGINDILVFEPTGGSYCRGDIVRSVDRDSHIPGPSCVLGDFVPFTRP
jgi:hypothetical protein